MEGLFSRPHPTPPSVNIHHAFSGFSLCVVSVGISHSRFLSVPSPSIHSLQPPLGPRILPPTVLSSVDDRRIGVKSEVCYHHAQPSFPPSTLPMQQPLQSLPAFCVKACIRTTMRTEIFHPPATRCPTPALLGRPVASQPGFEVALCSRDSRMDTQCCCFTCKNEARVLDPAFFFKCGW